MVVDVRLWTPNHGWHAVQELAEQQHTSLRFTYRLCGRQSMSRVPVPDLQLRHQQDALAGQLHQLSVYHTSQDNPLLPHLAAPTDNNTAEPAVQHKDPMDMLRARRYTAAAAAASCLQQQ